MKTARLRTDDSGNYYFSRARTNKKFSLPEFLTVKFCKGAELLEADIAVKNFPRGGVILTEDPPKNSNLLLIFP